VPPGLVIGDIDSDSDSGVNGSGCITDRGLKASAILTPISEIDWDCNSHCKLGKRCAYQPGFLPFVVKFRNNFWGRKGEPAPTSKIRCDKVEKLASKFHKGGITFYFGYSCIHDGKAINVEICESTFFKALGCGKTGQWVRAMKTVVGGLDDPIDKLARASFKTDKVKAYITYFLEDCDLPPTKNMQHVKILPFPNLRQFFEEYKSSFTVAYFAELTDVEAGRSVACRSF
jgi:hypothetical protein